MEHVVLNTGEAPEIVIASVGGDLRLFGWEQNQFTAEAEDPRSLTATQTNGRIEFNAAGDCTVRVPRRARLIIHHIGGDARIKSLEGDAEIQMVGGDVTLRQAGAVRLDQVGGDVSAKKISGPLYIQSALADVAARSVAGEFAAQRVMGDLYLRDVSQSANASVSGDVILNLSFVPGQDYAFDAAGNILCRVPPDAAAKLDLRCGGEIRVDVLGAKIEGNSNHKTVTLGSGEARVALRAGGDIALADLAADAEAMGDFGEHFGEEFGVMAEEFAAQIESQVESQIETQMAALEKHLSQHLSHLEGYPGRVKADEIAARARRAAERAGEIARRKGEAARRRAEVKVELARQKAERQAERARRFTSASWKFEAPRGPKPPTPPSAPVSEEERMTILRMLEQKKITVDEAEKLLAALENQA
ncbi:MAG: DUF4097 family beta strand repeat-containing protein [Anaerolineales bacterium]